MIHNAYALENLIGPKATIAFYGLHSDLAALVYGELSRAYGPRVPNVSMDQVEEFKTEDTGRFLADR